MIGAETNGAAKYNDTGFAPAAAPANGVANEISSLPSKVRRTNLPGKALPCRQWSTVISPARMTG
ncbi:hypothetical protein EDF73_103350 [Raoultella sp. BIGb0138]|nr:hypothetical protein EDF73_103350 [Raoultella sp. BIGb0138]